MIMIVNQPIKSRIVRIGRKSLINENFSALISNGKSHLGSADINAQ